MTEPCDLSAVELRRLIGAKQLSPVELMGSCIARTEATNPAVNALVATDFECGLAEARAAEQAVMQGGALGPLHGLPIGVKDLTDTAGLRTTYGSPLFRDHVPERDERLVAAIRRAGGIVVAKTNTPEFGTGGNTTNDVYGATGNPFDPALSCGGSSGGSGVALALSMLPLCHGSDTGGSLRKPAAWCGVVGFRPTPGLVASERRRLGLSTLGVQGPMARDVADTALFLSVLASDDPRDPMANPLLDAAAAAALARPPAVDLARLKVAWSVDLGFTPIAPSIRRVFEDRMRRLTDAFARFTPEDPDFEGIEQSYRVVRSVNFLAAYKAIYERNPADLGRNTRTNYEEGLKYSLADFAAAHAAQTRVYRAFQDFFGRHDLLIAPTQAMSPFPKDQLYPTDMEGMSLSHYFATSGITYAISMTGHPAISIPCGVDEKGLPFGLQIVGPRGGDAFTLGAALALEKLFAADPATGRPIPDPAKWPSRP
ncbi:Asp-tRNA(Asn)/Glu-tRNA(Gln) amidotransferase A subunit family amidase [Stella humosa]|uniref:Asp-tRNA(Asn)/Glu-tRNA(Gln) amidotransferase A subunit family amidase n=1 Tax=Stella humosa TaxID=94 RepID=A0A3N1M394_9PROT|nr:amidase family protein [Stella humosa]ROQ00212.1 Asp-tRNA(Asn)/Glu-tRNA(Gln) amidotransferase A subunit family amidase [Stella humosa]BBK30553.1 amidase [Stella humosa]